MSSTYLPAVVETVIRPDFSAGTLRDSETSFVVVGCLRGVAKQAFANITPATGLFRFLVWLLRREYIHDVPAFFEWYPTEDLRHFYYRMAMAFEDILSPEDINADIDARLKVLEAYVQQPAAELGLPLDLVVLTIYQYMVSCRKGRIYPQAKALLRSLSRAGRVNCLATKVALDTGLLLPALRRFSVRHDLRYDKCLRLDLEARVRHAQEKYFAPTLLLPPMLDACGDKRSCVLWTRQFYADHPHLCQPSERLLAVASKKSGSSISRVLRNIMQYQ